MKRSAQESHPDSAQPSGKMRRRHYAQSPLPRAAAATDSGKLHSGCEVARQQPLGIPVRVLNTLCSSLESPPSPSFRVADRQMHRMVQQVVQEQEHMLSSQRKDLFQSYMASLRHGRQVVELEPLLVLAALEELGNLHHGLQDARNLSQDASPNVDFYEVFVKYVEATCLIVPMLLRHPNYLKMTPVSATTTSATVFAFITRAHSIHHNVTQCVNVPHVQSTAAVVDSLVACLCSLLPLLSTQQMRMASNYILCMAQGNSIRRQRASAPKGITAFLPLSTLIDAHAVAIVPDEERADIFIKVIREELIPSSFAAVMDIPQRYWARCQTLDIYFRGESGYGEGVLRDWLCELAREIFYNTPRIFSLLPHHPTTVHLVPAVGEAEDCHYDMLHFAGRILGMAIKLNVCLPVRFSSATVRMMLGQVVDRQDLQEVEPEVARSCAAIRSCRNQDELSAMGFDDGFRDVAGDELFPGSANIAVDASNIKLYADMVGTNYLLKSAMAARLMYEGMLHVLHSDLIIDIRACLSRMAPAQFNEVIGGEGLDRAIDVLDWQQHTVVDIVPAPAPALKGDGGGARSIDHFFSAVASLNEDERRHLLRFWTGMQSLPAGGFGALPSKLKLTLRVYDPMACRKQEFGRRPSVHTCMMMLDVVVQPTMEGTCEMLREAILHQAIEDELP